MFTMKRNLIFVVLFASFAATAQGTEPISDSVDIEGLKKEYLEICKSQEYVAQRKASINFYRKLPDSKDLKYFTDNEVDFRAFVEKTLNSTRFASVDEAVAMRAQVLTTKKAFIDRYAYFFRKMANIPREDQKEILAPEFKTDDVLN